MNHPARVAERVATLDLVCDGRLDFGTGESSSAAELGGFLVDRAKKREMWEDAIDAITRMLVEEPFAGWDSEFIRMPPRNVVPKPLQKPHPPLWVACSRRETIHFAARNGIGALSFSFVEPEDAGKWVAEYYDILDSDECVPAGFAVNPNVSVVLPMMCHADEQTAIDRGIDGAHFFGYSLAHYYGMGEQSPGVTNIWEEFGSQPRAEGLLARDHRGRRRAPGRQAHAGGAGLPARGDRDPHPDHRSRAPVRGGRGRPGGLRAPGGREQARAHLRGAGALRLGRAARLRGRALRPRTREGRAPRPGRRAGAGAQGAARGPLCPAT